MQITSSQQNNLVFTQKAQKLNQQRSNLSFGTMVKIYDSFIPTYERNEKAFIDYFSLLLDNDESYSAIVLSAKKMKDNDNKDIKVIMVNYIDNVAGIITKPVIIKDSNGKQISADDLFSYNIIRGIKKTIRSIREVANERIVKNIKNYNSDTDADFKIQKAQSILEQIKKEQDGMIISAQETA